MERRNFFRIGLAATAALALAPSSLSAIDFRSTKPKAWTAMNPFKKGTKGDLAGGPNDHTGIKEAMREIFGSDSFEAANVKIKTPDIAENGAVVPVTVSSKLAGSKVAILNNANPESLVAVFTVPAGQPVDFAVRIKMQQTGDVVAVVESNGKLYGATKATKVTAGGCGG